MTARRRPETSGSRIHHLPALFGKAGLRLTLSDTGWRESRRDPQGRVRSRGLPKTAHECPMVRLALGMQMLRNRIGAVLTHFGVPTRKDGAWRVDLSLGMGGRPQHFSPHLKAAQMSHGLDRSPRRMKMQETLLSSCDSARAKANKQRSWTKPASKQARHGHGQGQLLGKGKGFYAWAG